MNDGHPTATVSQAERAIEVALDALAADPCAAHRLPPLMLWGPPGIGKSSIARVVAERRGIGFIDVRLAQREPVDLRGLPVPGEDGVRWLVAAEWPRDPASRGIILFDELTAADRGLQVAAYEFILDRRLGELYRVPDGWLLMGAGNRGEDRAVANAMSSALANRFCHLELAAEVETWATWAGARGIHPTVIAFLRARPDRLLAMEGDLERGWPSPRSWERVSHLLALPACDPALRRLLIAGLIGPGTAIAFEAFRELVDELPDTAAMLRGEAPCRIPETPDQRYALCAAAAHLMRHGSEQAAMLDGLIALATELPSDFACSLLVDLIRAPGPQLRVADILTHPGFASWRQRHRAVFDQRAAGAGIAA